MSDQHTSDNTRDAASAPSFDTPQPSHSSPPATPPAPQTSSSGAPHSAHQAVAQSAFQPTSSILPPTPPARMTSSSEAQVPTRGAANENQPQVAERRSSTPLSSVVEMDITPARTPTYQGPSETVEGTTITATGVLVYLPRKIIDAITDLGIFDLVAGTRFDAARSLLAVERCCEYPCDELYGGHERYMLYNCDEAVLLPLPAYSESPSREWSAIPVSSKFRPVDTLEECKEEASQFFRGGYGEGESVFEREANAAISAGVGGSGGGVESDVANVGGACLPAADVNQDVLPPVHLPIPSQPVPESSVTCVCPPPNIPQNLPHTSVAVASSLPPVPLHTDGLPVSPSVAMMGENAPVAAVSLASLIDPAPAKVAAVASPLAEVQRNTGSEAVNVIAPVETRSFAPLTSEVAPALLFDWTAIQAQCKAAGMYGPSSLEGLAKGLGGLIDLAGVGLRTSAEVSPLRSEVANLKGEVTSVKKERDDACAFLESVRSTLSSLLSEIQAGRE